MIEDFKRIAATLLIVAIFAFFWKDSPPIEASPDREVTRNATPGAGQASGGADSRAGKTGSISTANAGNSIRIDAKRTDREFWRTSLAEAEAELAADQVVLAYYTSETCAPCRRLEAEVFTDPELLAWWARYSVPVRIESVDRPTPTLLVYRPGSAHYSRVGFGKRAAVVEWFRDSHRKVFR